MYKWRLLLLASFAVFQPIASFTERSLIDGRQQCCDRQPHSLHRDTRVAVYGTYRFSKLAPEDRRLNGREIPDTRRYEVKGFDSVLTRTTERQDSRQSDLGRIRISLDREARITRGDHRRADIRDSREPSSRYVRNYRNSNFRQQYDELPTEFLYERRSLDSRRRNLRTRDNSENFREYEARNILQGTRNDVARDHVANERNIRRIVREVDLDRRSYVSRFESRQHVENNRRSMKEDGKGISASLRRNNDKNNNQIFSREFREVSRQVAPSRIEFRPQSRQASESRITQINDNVRMDRVLNKRAELKNSSRRERRVIMEGRVASQIRVDNRNEDTRISANLDQSRNRNSPRYLTRSRRETESRDVSRSERRENIRAATVIHNSIERNREASRNSVRDSRVLIDRVARITIRNIIESENRFTSERFNVQNNRDTRSFDRRSKVINEQRRSADRGATRDNYNERRNSASNHMHFMKAFEMQRASRDNLEQRFRQNRDSLLRATDIRVTRLDARDEARDDGRYINIVNPTHRPTDVRVLRDRANYLTRDIDARIFSISRVPVEDNEDTRFNRQYRVRSQGERRLITENRLADSKRSGILNHESLSLDRRSLRSGESLSRLIEARDIRLVNKRNLEDKEEISLLRVRESRMGRDMTSERMSLGRSQRLTDRSRAFDRKDIRLKYDAETKNQRQLGVRNYSDRRAMSDTRLTESRRMAPDMARERLSLDRRSADRSRVFELRDIRAEKNADSRNVRQHRSRVFSNLEERRAASESRLVESKSERDVTRFTHLRDSSSSQRYNDKIAEARKARESRSVEFRRNHAGVTRASESRLSWSIDETARVRNINPGEKSQESYLFILNWQYVFHTLQGLYLLGVFLQMMNDNHTGKNKMR